MSTETSISQFDVFKEMYGVNGTFLDYQSLIHKIPNYWKNMIINNRLVCIQTKYNLTCNIYVQYLLKETSSPMGNDRSSWSQHNVKDIIIYDAQRQVTLNLKQ